MSTTHTNTSQTGLLARILVRFQSLYFYPANGLLTFLLQVVIFVIFPPDSQQKNLRYIFFHLHCLLYYISQRFFSAIVSGRWPWLVCMSGCGALHDPGCIVTPMRPRLQDLASIFAPQRTLTWQESLFCMYSGCSNYVKDACHFDYFGKNIHDCFLLFQA